MPRLPVFLATHPDLSIDLILDDRVIDRLEEGASEASVGISGRPRVSAAEGVRAAVLGGMGLAVTSEWMFAPEPASGAVRTVLAECILPTIDLWAVFPTGRTASAKAHAFAAFVQAELHKPHSGRE